MSRPRLIIGTNNLDKVTELRDLLGDCGWDVLAPRDLGIALDVDETGASYADNARLKAEAFARASGLAALADDSGLEVDALNGEPGALHHLHGWDGADQAERIAILLRAMKDVPEGRRAARFRAVIVFVLPDGSICQEEGICEGTIGFEASGSGGFGYDPIFLLPGRGISMARLSIEEKNRISHRCIAASKIARRLRELASEWEASSPPR
ncbi:MAG TPA: RdgB/HAM1 family non-canonical purine NTP pyrophosphatase [Dehalococcoidia bacterium]|nr:RdgB/HAM1 family non-canonical purine NTP pyrophosphatase [Dehalococcoidia bacterium]